MHNFWVIGDIHGEIVLLDRLLEQIGQYGAERLVFVGDYIDRGPHSREVLYRLMDLEENACCLMGNHEFMMLNTLEDNGIGRSAMELWYNNGAESTLRSFGLSSFYELSGGIDASCLEFLKKLPMSETLELEGGARFLVSHAGIAPDLTLKEQLAVRSYSGMKQMLMEFGKRPEDSPLWVREAFFNADPALWNPFLVIHGHTPVAKLQRFVRQHGLNDFFFLDQDLAVRRNLKTGTFASLDVDSGSVLSGRLSGIGFFVEQKEGGDKRIRIKAITVSREKVVPRDLGYLPLAGEIIDYELG